MKLEFSFGNLLRYDSNLNDTSVSMIFSYKASIFRAGSYAERNSFAIRNRSKQIQEEGI